MPQQFTSFFKKLIDLREGSEEKHEIIERVKDDADISSARFWVLVFAIGVCSVGLNINSIPVVIGAMLISPLMGPIVSIGLALSIYDWGLMRRSFKNLMILVAISIFISSLYFALSPITNAQSELLSRIQPTIFDVLIAIFGGMAGFIGISRARHNNVIPGVAIATALMPPLCTVGYGIGTMQPKFIIGAFYLFLINCIFICLSALVVAKYLKLPKRDYPDIEHKQKVNRFITAIIVIIVTPAVYLAYTFVGQNNFNQSAQKYIETIFEEHGYIIVYENLNYSRNNKSIELAFLSEKFSEEELTNFKNQMTLFGLDDTKLIIRQNGFSLTEEEWENAITEIQRDKEKNSILEAKLENERLSFQSPTQLLDEAKSINSKVVDIAVGPVAFGSNDLDANSRELIIVYTDTFQEPITDEASAIITSWLKARLDDPTLNVLYVPEPRTSQ